MAVLIDENTKVICQGISSSARNTIAADNLDDAAKKIVKAVKG